MAYFPENALMAVLIAALIVWVSILPTIGLLYTLGWLK